ncbi:MAG: amidohydrolase family protein [Desulfatibacillaceae bacterium]
MVIDIHTHLFPRDVRVDRSGFFVDEPAFELLYKPEKSRMVGAAEMVAAMDEDGVDKSVIFGFPWESAELFTRHNDYILEAVNRYPDRFVGFACFDVYSDRAVDEARRCLEAGLRGLGELALYRSGIDDDALDRLAPLMGLAMEHGAPVLIHTNEPVGHMYPGKTPVTTAQVWNLVERFPDNRIILAHWGGGVFFFHLLRKNAKELMANLYLDSAASPYLYDPRIWDIACRTIGADKVLFGTDYPLIRAKRYMKELAEAGLSEEDLSKILGGNAKRLLGL